MGQELLDIIFKLENQIPNISAGTYFASRASAKTPAASGAAAEVPGKSES
mgnify:CR=1 FL=1